MSGGVARIARVLTAVLVALAAACSTPEPNAGSSDPSRTAGQPSAAPGAPGASGPRQDADLTGRIVDREGRPVVGLPVTVSERGDVNSVIGAALTAGFTFGIACVADPLACDGGDQVVDSTTTGSDGRYELTLPGAYLPGYETDADWVVTIGRPPGDDEVTGPSSSFELEVNTSVQEAPDLAIWDAPLTIADRDGVLIVSVPPLTATAAAANVTTRFVGSAGVAVWRLAGTTVDPRVLEDGAIGIVAAGTADVTVRHTDGRTIYHQGVVAPTRSFVSTMIPPSRGAACSAVGTPSFVGCPVTDGDLVDRTELAGPVTLDLGAPVEVGLVVARMVVPFPSEDLAFEVSTDATTWTTLAFQPMEGAEGYAAAPTQGTGVPSARYLRVSAGAGPLEVAELSIWGPTAADRIGAAAPRTGDDSSSGTDRPPAAIVVGAAMLLALVGAWVFGVGRRRFHRT